MTHPLVLALFLDANLASAAARRVRDLGVDRRDLSIVARSHEAEGRLADRVGGSPGAEIEDSKAAGALGDLGGHLLAAIAVVLPGIGPIVAGGPLAAGLGEAAGHLAGGLRPVLQGCGLSEHQAAQWERSIERGAVLLGVHVRTGDASLVQSALEGSQASTVAVVSWGE